METYRIPESKCPQCGKKQDASTETVRDGRKPVAGDVSICAYCAAINLFAVDLSIRSPTEDELQEMRKDVSGWIMVQEAVEFVRSNNRRKNP